MKDIEIVEKWFKTFYSIGADESGGVTRLGYTKNEDVMHGAIRNIARDLGLKYSSDEVGNTYIYEEDWKEYYLIGSHLDSVAFGIATVGSGLITHKLDINKLKEVYNTEGKSLYETLKFKGYKPECSKIKGVKKYFEIHIEQGRRLEDNNLKIGIVDAIANATRYWLTIEGRQDHSGAAPMGMRKDALCAGAEIVLQLERLAGRESKYKSVGTVGFLQNYPNAFNVVPGKVRMGIDIRGVDWESIQRIDNEIVEYIEKLCKIRELKYNLDLVAKGRPVILDENLKSELESVTQKLGIDYMVMNSGAGHDAMKFYDIAPTGMVFIPCKEGISHNIAEEIEKDDIILVSKIIFEYLKNRI